MNKIYAGIDLGSDTIKIIVSELVNEKFHVLAAVSKPSKGIIKGQISDTKPAVESIKSALVDIKEMLGFPLKKIIACVPTKGCKMTILEGSVDILNTECITGEDISRVLKDALIGKINSEEELVTAIPISFTVDEEEKIKDPKGMKGDTLETKVVVATVLKEPLYRMLEVLKLAGLEVADIAFGTIGDYYEVRNKELDKKVGAIINIGKSSTDISIFNKGIMIKHTNLNIGSHHIDKDLQYIFHISKEDSIRIKEEFATAKESLADDNDEVEVEVIEDKKKKNERISQRKIAKVTEARLTEILQLSKEKIKNLTNRDIRYIIITGGVSEMSGFLNLAEDVLGSNVSICNIKTIGIRHNKYSSVSGLIKYFKEKLELRDKEYNIVNEDDINALLSTSKKEVNHDNILNKVFGHFFDN